MPQLAPEVRPAWLLAAMSGVLALITLDETVVGVALATMRRDLALSQVDAHWVVNAYLLSFTAAAALGGWMGDRWRRRDVLLAGLAIFAAASLAAALAPDGAWLIGARAAEGVGAALVFPACFAVITRAFGAERRGWALGWMTTIGAIAMASGPLVGGAFAQTLSWRWIFWINLPVIAVITVLLIAAWLPRLDDAPVRRGGLDLPGLATLVAGLAALVVALMQGPEWGWGAPHTLVLGAAGVILLAGFTVIELKRAAPLIDLSLLRIASFTGGDLVFFAFQFDKIIVFVFVALFLQDKRGFSAIEAGLVLLVAVLPSLGTSLLAGKLADRLGSRRPLLAGITAQALALLGVALASSSQSTLLIVAPLLLWGASLPLLAVPARRALMGAVPAARHGQASGVNLTIQMLGGTVGMAICGSLLAVTGDYRLVFAVTAGALAIALVLAWRLVDWPGTTRDRKEPS